MSSTTPTDPTPNHGDCPLESSLLGAPPSEMDFDPRFYPTATCVSAPDLPPTNLSERIQREFRAVYYRLNRLSARLAEARAIESPPGSAGERATLQEIEQYLRLRDDLEDRYAPYGVIAEAVVKDGFTVEIKFTFGDRTVLRQQRTRLVSSTALVFFPEPDRADPGQTAKP